MIDTEDSVVTSLNELRKLKNERKTRKNKQRTGAARPHAAPVADPTADMVTPPPAQAMATVAARPSQTFAPAQAFAMPAQAPQAPAFAPMVAPTVIKKSSATPAILVALLLIGAGAGGYIKLENDTKALLDSKNVLIRDAEEARNKAVEANARLEQQAKNTLQKCEDKLKLATVTPAPTATSIATAAPAIVPAPTVASTPSVTKRSTSKPTASRHATSRPSRHVAASDSAAPGATKASAVPTIAKKKTLQDDPLAGLGR